MELEKIDEIGRGKVWTGRQALEHGLVDGIGGLDLGLTKIRELTGLSERSYVRIYEPDKGYVPPPSKPVSTLKFVFENAAILFEKAACICPWGEFRMNGKPWYPFQ
jgi:ClpP class serine protease